MCVKSDRHERHVQTYLLIRSVEERDSGIYTCRSHKNQSKSVHVDVRGQCNLRGIWRDQSLSRLCWFALRLPAAKGYLSVRLEESRIFSAVNASGSCLEANVSYSPVIQHCVWETPDNTLVKCTLQNWVTNSNRCTVPSEVNVSKIQTNSLLWIFFFLSGVGLWSFVVQLNQEIINYTLRPENERKPKLYQCVS